MYRRRCPGLIEKALHLRERVLQKPHEYHHMDSDGDEDGDEKHVTTMTTTACLTITAER